MKNMEVLGFKIVDYDNEIRIPTDIDIINNLYRQEIDFNELKLSSRNYKRIFLNYFIKNTIDYITNNKKSFLIIGKPQHSEFFEWFHDHEKFISSYDTNISTILKILPILAYKDTYLSFDEILESKESELREWLSSEIITKKDKASTISFKKIKDKINYYNLSYLDNKIFNELKFKSI